MSALDRLVLRENGRPVVTDPKATCADSGVEPPWEERLTVTVGPGEADLVGCGDRVIQAAIDYMARYGGGTVRILPGTYHLRNAIYLRRGIRILGGGAESVLIKCPSSTSALAADSDWYAQEITLADADGFEVGDGVCLRGKHPGHELEEVYRRTLVARIGDRFKLDRGLRKNFWISRDAVVSTLFPLIDGDCVQDVTIENLTLDGNRANNDRLDGNYAGCIFLQDCSRVAIRKVTTRNNNGDGISWQISHDVVIEECHCHDNADLGLHPGSGSQRPLMRRNRIERNDVGLFFCWGVKYGLAEENTITDCGSTGISIGHRDTDNLIRNNTVTGSGEVGVLFRKERGEGYTGDRNYLANNRIIDGGAEEGVGIDIQGTTDNLVLVGNEIRETREPARRAGVRISPEAGAVILEDNRIIGLATPVADLREG